MRLIPMAGDFQLEQQTEKPIRVNESKLGRSAAWQSLFLGLKGNSVTTTQLAAMMNMETKAAYRAAKAFQREGLLSIVPPSKSGQPCTITLNEKVRFVKK